MMAESSLLIWKQKMTADLSKHMVIVTNKLKTEIEVQEREISGKFLIYARRHFKYIY